MSNFIVDAVLDATPAKAVRAVTDPHDIAPIAARQAVAVIRALTKDYPSDFRMPMSVLTALADEIEAEFRG